MNLNFRKKDYKSPIIVAEDRFASRVFKFMVEADEDGIIGLCVHLMPPHDEKLNSVVIGARSGFEGRSHNAKVRIEGMWINFESNFLDGKFYAIDCSFDVKHGEPFEIGLVSDRFNPSEKVEIGISIKEL